MDGLILGVSGIRGIVGKSLTSERLRCLVRTWGSLVPGRIVVGRDSRISGGQFLAEAVRELLRQGHAVYHLDIVPTPTVGRAVRRWEAAAGLQITASHNPPEWNGVKFFTAQGRALPPNEAKPLLERLRVALELPVSADADREGDREGLAGSCPQNIAGEAVEDHLGAVLSCVDGEAIRRRKFRVLVDGNGGAGGPFAVRLLEALGCQVFPVHCQADGIFRHAPEPTPRSLSEVAEQVARGDYDLGLALDTDADRLVLIDERGRCLSEELSLALAVESRLRQQPGPVVINLSTSRVIEMLCQRRGCAWYRTPVGEAHVVDGMLMHGAVLGGEGNGGIIDPRVGWIRDPFIGMALVLELLSDCRKPLSQLILELPRLSMRKEKLPLADLHWPQIHQRLLTRIRADFVDTRDGLYFRWPDRWLHLRPSNTEPSIRIVAESESETDTDALMQLAYDVLSG